MEGEDSVAMFVVGDKVRLGMHIAPSDRKTSRNGDSSERVSSDPRQADVKPPR